MIENTNKNDSERGFPIDSTSTFSFCFEWIELIAQSLIVVIFTFVFLFRIFTVDGDSMLNTLHNGDRIIVQRFNYTPSNGDVVVIRKYKDMTAAIIKRVIATSGQTVDVNFESGRVSVDNKLLKESYIKERMRLKGDTVFPLKVPENHCLVMGDNRNNSLDSRFTALSTVPYSYVVGRAVLVYFPFYRFGGISSQFNYAVNGEENGVPEISDDEKYDQSNSNDDNSMEMDNNDDLYDFGFENENNAAVE